MDQGAWWATVHGVAQGQTRLSNWECSAHLRRTWADGTQDSLPVAHSPPVHSASALQPGSVCPHDTCWVPDPPTSLRYFSILYSENGSGPSLVAHWLGIHQPMQGTQDGSLVQEDPTYHRATKPVCHSYGSPSTQSPCSTTRETTALRSPHTMTKSSPC